mmetsp:Transcript_26445/g.57459  ORF Transcript_26445/g.57459 Transcript_26445/m.57459 type:complete len:305 (-) Transcript_26445:1099-2013(-)
MRLSQCLGGGGLAREGPPKHCELHRKGEVRQHWGLGVRDGELKHLVNDGALLLVESDGLLRLPLPLAVQIVLQGRLVEGPSRLIRLRGGLGFHEEGGVQGDALDEEADPLAVLLAGHQLLSALAVLSAAQGEGDELARHLGHHLVALLLLGLLVRRLRLAPPLRLQRRLRLELRLEGGAELRLALQRLLVVLLAPRAVLVLPVRAVLAHHLLLLPQLPQAVRHALLLLALAAEGGQQRLLAPLLLPLLRVAMLLQQHLAPAPLTLLARCHVIQLLCLQPPQILQTLPCQVHGRRQLLLDALQVL